MSLAGFTRIGEYTIPTIASVVDPICILLKYDDFDATVLSNLRSDLGDLRFSRDAAGTQQIPLEVVNDDVAGGNVQVWTRTPSLNTGDIIHIWGSSPSSTQPAATDPFGRNAVWQDFELVIHQGTTTDSTGNNSPSLVGSPSLTSMLWGGQGYNITGTTQRIDVPHRAAFSLDSGYSYRIWVNNAGGKAFGSYIYDKTNGNSDGLRIFKLSGQTVRHRTPDTAVSNQDSATNTSGLDRVICDWDGTAERKRIVFQDGTVDQNNLLISSTITTPSTTAAIGNAGGGFGTERLDGVLGEFWIQTSVPNLSVYETEYANQSAVGAWGTMTSTGGGGTSQPITVVNATQAETANTLTLNQSAELASVSATQPESASALLLNIAQQITAINAVQNETASAVSITQSGSQEVQSVAATQNESATTLSLSEQQQLASIVAAQIESAGLTNLTSAQALTLVVASQNESAAPITINQSDGQLITIIDAMQAETAQTILISQVSVAQLNQASQNEVAQTLSIAQLQPLISVSATQVELAQLLNIIHSGDKTDLSGLTLVPVTNVYTLTQINNPIYSLEEN